MLLLAGGGYCNFDFLHPRVDGDFELSDGLLEMSMDENRVVGDWRVFPPYNIDTCLIRSQETSTPKQHDVSYTQIASVR